MSVNEVLESLHQERLLLEQGTTEFALIKRLQTYPHHLFTEDCLQDSLRMFQTHFILFHALYLLRDTMRETENKDVEISVQRIQIVELPSRKGEPLTSDLVHEDKLRQYYLDISNLNETGKEDVEQLLDGFWKAMGHGAHYTEEEIQHAFAHFSLDENTTFTEVKRRYRSMMLSVHPDKGGNRTDAQMTEAAYRQLKAYFKARA
ncbi:hypothetical protein OE749_12845 [Aestuariibacter sp. AA17]|uniref:J domain-containing protein n=1 Tax=Fluctibacter corallii TaxID=2984329 RepID=A0ABT3AA80_9ALTE|nr:DNA-J related domain-containing protein [Aestuariibacter sp. AA17]MCV2885580.1 hypothetical protein [Aestuariibacter sp. AA17]